MSEKKEEEFVMRDGGAEEVVDVEGREVEEEETEEERLEREIEERNEDLMRERSSGPPTIGQTPGVSLGYDSEWVRFLDQLSKDESMESIAVYINSIHLSSRAKEKLIVYITTLLDREFAVSRIENNEDFLKVYDKKQILDADLPLGLTRFDQSPGFQHILDLVALKWDIKVRRSFGAGFERKILATSRSENISEERIKTIGAKKTTKEKLTGLFGQ